MTVILFHASRSGDTIGEFNAFTHFGTKKAALDRSQSEIFNGVEPSFYKVEFASQNPLRIDDLFSATRSNNHGLYALTDHLHYDAKAISAEERMAVFSAAAPSGQNKEAGLAELANILKKHGFDSIVYNNQFEGRNSDSYISIDQSCVTIIEVLNTREMQERDHLAQTVKCL